MLKPTLPSAWWSRCLLTVATYIVAADFLPTLLLIVISRPVILGTVVKL
jgi:hypothetical protein